MARHHTAAPARWLVYRTPITTAAAIDASIREARHKRGEYLRQPARKRIDAWPILRAGLLSTAAGLRGLDLARHTGRAAGTVSRRIRLHLDWLRDDASYAEVAGRILRAALDGTPGGA